MIGSYFVTHMDCSPPTLVGGSNVIQRAILFLFACVRDRRFFVAVAEERFPFLHSLYWFNLSNPDISKPHGVSVILDRNGSLWWVCLVLRGTIERGVSQQLEVVED